MLTSFGLASVMCLATAWNVEPVDGQIGRLQAENAVAHEEFEVTGWAIFEHGETIEGDVSASRKVGKDDSIYELKFPPNTDLNKLGRRGLKLVVSGRILPTKGLFDRPQIEVSSFSLRK